MKLSLVLKFRKELNRKELVFYHGRHARDLLIIIYYENEI